MVHLDYHTMTTTRATSSVESTADFTLGGSVYPGTGTSVLRILGKLAFTDRSAPHLSSERHSGFAVLGLFVNNGSLAFARTYTGT
jgi:hypothetical protein